LKLYEKIYGAYCHTLAAPRKHPTGVRRGPRPCPKETQADLLAE
jgi:hypothetical protein